MSKDRNKLSQQAACRCGFAAGESAGESISSSPALIPVCSVVICTLAVVISLSSQLVVRQAQAATWPVSTSELSASVAFHETYSAGDKSYVHSGIDIPASAGMQISSPLAGTVRYTGAVPSGDSRIGGDSSNLTMNAVSIELADGRVITLMPFSSISVSEGDSVREGACLGKLAPSGDISSSSPHLHMGLKRASTYYDPMSLFGVVPNTADIDAVQEDESARALGAATAPLAVNPEIPSVEAAEPTQLPTEETALAPEVVEEAFGTIETGAYDWQPRKKETPSLSTLIGGAIEPVMAACYEQLASFLEAISTLSSTTGVPLSVLLLCCMGLSLFAAIALTIIAFRFMVPRIAKLWRIAISSLSEQRGGVRMHWLFPASGTAFTSRSRISPREVTK